MNHWLGFKIRCVFVVALWILTALPCSAWVIFRTLKKGEVYNIVSQELRSVLLKVPPLGGTEVTGSWNSCTMFYRGTQASLQELIDDLAKIKGNHVTVSIDRSGQPGRFEPTKTHPLPHPIIYQFSVSVSTFPRPANAPHKHNVSIRVHTAGGIKADKIILPKKVNTPKYNVAPPNNSPIRILEGVPRLQPKNQNR